MKTSHFALMFLLRIQPYLETHSEKDISMKNLFTAALMNAQLCITTGDYSIKEQKQTSENSELSLQEILEKMKLSSHSSSMILGTLLFAPNGITYFFKDIIYF